MNQKGFQLKIYIQVSLKNIRNNVLFIVLVAYICQRIRDKYYIINFCSTFKSIFDCSF